MNCPGCSKLCQENAVFSLPNCGHVFCTECATQILFSNTRCPCCQSASISQTNPTVIPPEPAPTPPQREESEVKYKETTAKANEVVDQCLYLQYVNESLARKNQEQYNILLNVIQEIEKNYTLIINHINESKQTMLNQIYKINEENQDYCKKLAEEISNLARNRTEVKFRIGQGFQCNTYISEQDTKAFQRFDYPKFAFKFFTVRLKVVESEFIKKAKQILGNMERIKWEGKELEYSNNDGFKKYRTSVGNQNSGGGDRGGQNNPGNPNPNNPRY